MRNHYFFEANQKNCPIHMKMELSKWKLFCKKLNCLYENGLDKVKKMENHYFFCEENEKICPS